MQNMLEANRPKTQKQRSWFSRFSCWFTYWCFFWTTCK